MSPHEQYIRKELQKLFNIEKVSKKTYFLKTTYGRHAGKITVHRFIMLKPNGLVIAIDATRQRISVCKTFGSIPLLIARSNRQEWHREFNKIIKVIES